MTHDRPYRLFNVVLARKVMLAPWMARLTFHGDDVARMSTHAPDQRVKILFPHDNGTTPALADRPDWYATYRATPPQQRGPIRTYTIRHLRADAKEVDIDFVLHGENGPASRWATHARIGDGVQIVAPNRAFSGDQGGYEWRPPEGVDHILLAADETALPALAGILDSLAALPARPSVQAFIDAPIDVAAIGLPSWPSLDLKWLRQPSSDGRLSGIGLIDAVRGALLPAPNARQAPGEHILESVDVDRQILWERAEAADTGFYAWIAGEASAVLAIRAFLIKERGLDRRALNLMGYWRRGQALDEPASQAA